MSMNRMRVVMQLVMACGLLCWLAGAGVAQAGIEAYTFASETEEQRYRSLIEELRCPKCQNQNLADSDALIAHDLRDRVHGLMQQGQSDEDIRAYLQQRYGDFILYQPPLTGHTLVLWLAPALLLLVAGLIIGWRVRRRQSANVSVALDVAAQTELERLLAVDSDEGQSS